MLEAKFRMGLFEHPFALEGAELHGAFTMEGAGEASLQAARQSLVLLKNNGVLPLSRPAKLAVIGPHADCARKMFGGYTHLCMMESIYAVASSIAGVEGNGAAVESADVRFVPGTKIQSDEGERFDEILRRQKPGCRSLLEELRARMPDTEVVYAYGYPIAGADESGFAQALEAVRQADAVILTLGGKHGTCSIASMGEGVDASNINLPPCQDAFLSAAAKLGKPLIGVHFDGRPISSDAADTCLDAIRRRGALLSMGRRRWPMHCWETIIRAANCPSRWLITPGSFPYITIIPTVPRGMGRRASALLTMWTCPIRRGITSDTVFPIRSLRIQILPCRLKESSRKKPLRSAVRSAIRVSARGMKLYSCTCGIAFPA